MEKHIASVHEGKKFSNRNLTKKGFSKEKGKVIIHFSKKRDLKKSDNQIQDKKVPLQCLLCGKFDLYQHLASAQEGIQLLKCKTCNVKVSSVLELKDHAYIVHGEVLKINADIKAFECNFCRKDLPSVNEGTKPHDLDVAIRQS